MTTPTETPPTDPLTAVFEAMLRFLAALLSQRPREPVRWIETEAAALRTLIQRAAEEHARCTPSAAWEQLRKTATEAVEAYEDTSDGTDGYEHLFTAIDEALGAIATAEETAEEPARRTEPQAAAHQEPTVDLGSFAHYAGDPPLTEADLRAAEERCERATPGPWEIDSTGLIRTTSPEMLDDPIVLASTYPGEQGKLQWTTEDRAFIAAARTDLPRALREIRRLRRVEALVGGLEQANREAHQGLARRKAEIERLHSLLREARRRLTPLPLAMHPEDHEDDTLPARMDAALGGKDH